MVFVDICQIWNGKQHKINWNTSINSIYTNICAFIYSGANFVMARIETETSAMENETALATKINAGNALLMNVRHSTNVILRQIQNGWWDKKDTVNYVHCDTIHLTYSLLSISLVCFFWLILKSFRLYKMYKKKESNTMNGEWQQQWRDKKYRICSQLKLIT